MPTHACSTESFCFRQTLTCLELGERCAQPQGRLDCQSGVRPTNVVTDRGVETPQEAVLSTAELLRNPHCLLVQWGFASLWKKPEAWSRLTPKKSFRVLLRRPTLLLGLHFLL